MPPRLAIAVHAGRRRRLSALQAPVPPPVSERFQFRRRHRGRRQRRAVPGARARTAPTRSATTAALRPFADEAEVAERSGPGAGLAQAAGTDSRVLHPGGESRRPVDRRPARGPRARAVRENSEAARGAESRKPAPADAAGARTHAGAAGRLRRNLRRTGQQRIRSRTLRRAQHRGKDRARRSRRFRRSSTCCTNCSTSLPAKSRR